MPARRDPKRPLLIGGVVLMGLGGALEVGARYGGAAAGPLDAVAPWIVLVGSLLTLLYFVVRRAAKPPPVEKRESVLFDESTQIDPASRLDAADRDRP